MEFDYLTKDFVYLLDYYLTAIETIFTVLGAISMMNFSVSNVF